MIFSCLQSLMPFFASPSTSCTPKIHASRWASLTLHCFLLSLGVVCCFPGLTGNQPHAISFYGPLYFFSAYPHSLKRPMTDWTDWLPTLS